MAEFTNKAKSNGESTKPCGTPKEDMDSQQKRKQQLTFVGQGKKPRK